MSQDLLESAENGVVTLTMNRPAALNALTRDMLVAMQDALMRAAEDPQTRVIVLTGAGRGFCAGGDVKNMNANADADEPLASRVHSLRRRMEVSRLLHEIPKPTIAMMRGPAAGAGLSLALACDLRIASDTTRMTTAFARVGLSGDFGGSYFLTQLVGAAKAREMYFLSDTVTADQALALNLVTKLAPDAALEAQTAEIATRLAQGPAVTLGYMKQNINAAESGSLAEAFDLEAAHHAATSMTEDHREAARAFVEKRPPVYKGR
ncbi:MAG: 2-(1,2-epoxy-1,2-dihydrophenyl)acetyl-CoA isomerase [Alphaproteobacteria bacterium]|jgi:2-(1,2-epoxy-1,2-dihydrophenyl)acetyl-CoA isomerase